MTFVPRWDEGWHEALDRELADLAFRGPVERRAIRRALGERDPVAFALIYLRDHLRRPVDPRDPDGPRPVSFARCHYEWAALAMEWMRPGQRNRPLEDRHVVVAPRETGKSTWWYLILPLWAGAFGYRSFVAAFAHATAQAEQHLATFRHELETNPLLLHDFPELSAATRRGGGTLADRAGLLHTRKGFIFGARGIDSAVLGMKVGKLRPDLIIMDDIEPDEARYSPDLVRKRLGTVRDAILPMNIYASVALVGTVQIPGSIIHQAVRLAKGEVYDENEWLDIERFQVHWSRAITELDNGEVESLWPEKWPLDFLLGIQGTRSYTKNYDNDPADSEAPWWRRDDVVYEEFELDDMERRVLFVDGAVTEKPTSDYTGLAVVGLDPRERRFYVCDATEIRLTGEPRRQVILDLIQRWQVRYVMVEANQGGDLWYTELHGLPVRVVTFTNSEKKEVRLRRLLAMYQKIGNPVRHLERLALYERRLFAYPHVEHDDVIDAVAAAVEHLTWVLLRLLGRVATNASVQQFAYAPPGVVGRATAQARARRRAG